MRSPFSFADPLISLFQSAVHEVGGGLGRARHGAAAMAAAGHAVASRAARLPLPTVPEPATLGDLRPCARLGLELLAAAARGDGQEVHRLQQSLVASPCDPLWATTLTTYLGYFGVNGTWRRIPYVPPDEAGEAAITVPAGARVALISDWGTGTDTAESVLRHAASLRPDLLLHLGDIYYSGTERECREHATDLFDRVLGPPGARIPIFALAGNHDMYSGGAGYYGMIGRLNQGAMQQKASYVCLRSEDGAWQLLGMDTGLRDYNPFSDEWSHHQTRLEPAEEEWHLRRIQEFGGPTLLLSHHPLFSAFRQIGPREAGRQYEPVNECLLASYRRFTGAGRIAAWFWGHEHNLCVYEPYAGLKRGRCVGNGAIPMLVQDQPYRILDNLDDPPRIVPGTELGHDETDYRHGFALLDTGIQGILAQYYEHGREAPLHEERLLEGGG